jgi:HEAT repeat protein
MDVKRLKDIPPWEWPEGTAEMLLEVLQDRSGDAADRLLAAELAGDFAVINAELVEALLAILRRGDESEALRGTAAVALGPVLEQSYIDEFETPDNIPITPNTFHEIQETLRSLYTAADVPREVRRRVLEAAVRAPQDWHPGAIRAAYSSDDDEWRLTAVFGMRFVRGFETQILDALDSEDPEIEYEAVCAAGNWELAAAWPHVRELVLSEDTDKALLLAAIEAAAAIRPLEAVEILDDLTDSDDEDIVEAAYEALTMAGVLSDMDDEDDDLDN